jgi:uncharacterized protein
MRESPINLFNATKTVVIKTNNSCNLHCTYCYDEFNQIKARPSLSNETYVKIQDKLISYSKNKGIDHLNIIWHGGEPMLMGLGFYKKAIRQQQECEFKFFNLMQTNATLLNAEWMDFFKANDFKIGISFDGSPKANSVHRQKTEIVMRSIRELNVNGITPSVICVISDQNYVYWKELFDFFADFDVEYIDLVPCYENNGRYTLTDEHYINFYTHVFDLWLKNEGRPNIRTFSNIVDLLKGNDMTEDFVTCSLTGRCGEIISVSPEGDVYFCDCLPKEPANMIGNVIKNNLYSLSKSSNYTELKKYVLNINTECLQCKFRSACGGGCLTRRKSNFGKDYYCHARKTLYSYICKSLNIKVKPLSFTPIPAFTRGPQPSQD